MEDSLTRLWNDLVARIGGPMSFRLVLQADHGRGRARWPGRIQGGSAQALQQPAHGPVRAGRRDVEHPLRLFLHHVLHHAFMVLAVQAIVTPFVETFKEFPRRQKAASFTIDQALERMTEPMAKAA